MRSPGAVMATPDQKSPNVLLQNLCCRILGRSEGTRPGAQAVEAERRDPRRPGAVLPSPREGKGCGSGLTLPWGPGPELL